MRAAELEVQLQAGNVSFGWTSHASLCYDRTCGYIMYAHRSPRSEYVDMNLASPAKAGPVKMYSIVFVEYALCCATALPPKLAGIRAA